MPSKNDKTKKSEKPLGWDTPIPGALVSSADQLDTGWGLTSEGQAAEAAAWVLKEQSELASKDTVVTDPNTEDWSVVPIPTYAPLIIKQHSGTFDAKVAKILIYGESGVGKTRFGSTFPDVIFIDIDKGMASVTEEIDIIEIDTFKQIEGAYAWLKAGNHGYTTVVLDTLNELQRIAMRATVADFPMIRRSYEDLPSMSDYGKMLHDMVELTRDFIALPMCVVLLAQIGSRQFDTDVLMPQLVGKNTAREICRKMDVIGAMYKAGEGDRQIPYISFDAIDYVTKDRSFRLPVAIPEPTYISLAQYWR